MLLSVSYSSFLSTNTLVCLCSQHHCSKRGRAGSKKLFEQKILCWVWKRKTIERNYQKQLKPTENQSSFVSKDCFLFLLFLKIFFNIVRRMLQWGRRTHLRIWHSILFKEPHYLKYWTSMWQHTYRITWFIRIMMLERDKIHKIAF